MWRSPQHACALPAKVLNRLAALGLPPPIVRYEHPNPGDMLHLDIKNWGVSTSQATGFA